MSTAFPSVIGRRASKFLTGRAARSNRPGAKSFVLKPLRVGQSASARHTEVLALASPEAKDARPVRSPARSIVVALALLAAGAFARSVTAGQWWTIGEAEVQTFRHHGVPRR